MGLMVGSLLRVMQDICIYIYIYQPYVGFRVGGFRCSGAGFRGLGVWGFRGVGFQVEGISRT